MPQHSPRSNLGEVDMRPTVQAQIIDTRDALILVQKCIEGILNPIARRPHDRERADLVRAGNVFIYTEEGSGIKRWTDGVNWSPSRILNNFLVYRELDKAFPPGEKKKATKRAKRHDPYQRDRDRHHQIMQNNLHAAAGEGIHVAGASRMLTKEEERLLVGSLNESYFFKRDGLIKKTISLTYDNQTWHIVWYFTYLAHIEGAFKRPSERWPEQLYARLVAEQVFRCPLNPDGSEPNSSTGSRERHNRRSNSINNNEITYQQNNTNNQISPKQKKFMPLTTPHTTLFPQYAPPPSLFHGNPAAHFPRQQEQEVPYYGTQQPPRFPQNVPQQEYSQPFGLQHLEPTSRPPMPTQFYMNSPMFNHNPNQLPSIQPQLHMHQPRGGPLLSPHHYRNDPQQYHQAPAEYDQGGHSNHSSPHSTSQVHMPHLMAPPQNPDPNNQVQNNMNNNNINEDPAMNHDGTYPRYWSRN